MSYFSEYAETLHSAISTLEVGASLGEEHEVSESVGPLAYINQLWVIAVRSTAGKAASDLSLTGTLMVFVACSILRKI